MAHRTQTPLRKKIRKRAKLAVLPHAENQYRPHATRRYALVFIVFLALVFQGAYNHITTGGVLGERSTVTPESLLIETNSLRVDQAAEPLVYSEQLSKAAQLKAQDMLKKQYWSHSAPDGTPPWFWVEESGYRYSQAGENLARGFNSSSAITDAWMQSPEHRKNMLSLSYEEVGFAVASGMLNGELTTLVVALYGQPATQAIAGDMVNYTGASTQSMSPIAQFGFALQQLTPATLGTVFLLLMLSGVAIVAHFTRRRLPQEVYNSWRRHHGLYKAAGLSVFAIIIMTVYTGGSI